ncbi:MAG: AMP-binding protein [Pseudomonadota bacterium]
MAELNYAERLAALAAAHPNAPMLTVLDRTGAEIETLTWGDADRRANRLANGLAAAGLRPADYMTIALPNSAGFVISCLAAWKLGAVPQPVSSALPEPEMDAIVELAESRAVIGVPPERYPGRICLDAAGLDFEDQPASPPPPALSPAWKAPTSGGSTGRPKLIVSGDPALYDPDDTGLSEAAGFAAGGVTLMPGPLYHNGPFIWVFTQLLVDGHVVVLSRFDAETTLTALAHYRADIVYLVPTMMSRIWKLPANIRETLDLSALRRVWHLAAPCPEWLKRAWIEWLGPERIFELYGGTEAQAFTMLDGTEWLSHPGSVGRVASGEIRILDADGQAVPDGTVGEVYMRPEPGRVPYYYRGATPRQLDGGWESLGDMGWTDADGFLYLADRRTDMILSGGANVYPAEIEAALEAHPAVRSCAVIGLPDDDLGQVAHAIVEAEGLDAEALDSFVGARLARYKCPRTYEFVTEPLRDDAGKVRRSSLREARV